MLWSQRGSHEPSAETRRAESMVRRGGWVLAVLGPVLMLLVVAWPTELTVTRHPLPTGSVRPVAPAVIGPLAASAPAAEGDPRRETPSDRPSP